MDADTNVKWVVLLFAQNETKNVFYWVRDSIYLYHVTNASNIPVIKRQGLVPHASDNRYKYRPRTYFFIEEDKGEAYRFAHQMYMYHQDRGYDYAMIKVDVSKLPDDSHFFFDPMIDSAVFTIDDISKNCIVDIEEFDVRSYRDFENVYKPRKSEIEQEKKATDIIRRYCKDVCPQIKHTHQFVRAPFDNDEQLHDLRQMLVDAGVSCSSIKSMDDGVYFDMNFRLY